MGFLGASRGPPRTPKCVRGRPNGPCGLLGPKFYLPGPKVCRGEFFGQVWTKTNDILPYSFFLKYYWKKSARWLLRGGEKLPGYFSSLPQMSIGALRPVGARSTLLGKAFGSRFCFSNCFKWLPNRCREGVPTRFLTYNSLRSRKTRFLQALYIHYREGRDAISL